MTLVVTLQDHLVLLTCQRHTVGRRFGLPTVTRNGSDGELISVTFFNSCTFLKIVLNLLEI